MEGSTPTSYTMDHSAGSYVYDTRGRLRVYHRYGSGAAALAADLKILLAEKLTERWLWLLAQAALSAADVNESAKLVGRQAAAGAEIGAGRLHHYRRTAGIHLVTAEVGKVGHHGLVNKARAARPVVFCQGIRHHRHIYVRWGMAAACSCNQACMYRSAGRQPQYTATGRVMPFELHVLDQRLDGGEPGARGQKIMGLALSSRKKKLP